MQKCQTIGYQFIMAYSLNIYIIIKNLKIHSYEHNHKTRLQTIQRFI